MNECYDANIRIRDFPRLADRRLNAIAAIRGIPKWELVRIALLEFVEKYKGEASHV